MLRGLGEFRNDLNAGRAGADDADALVRKAGHRMALVAPGVLIVPATGVEGVAGEALDAGDAGKLRVAEEPGTGNHEARGDPVAAVGRDRPAGERLVPHQFLY